MPKSSTPGSSAAADCRYSSRISSSDRQPRNVTSGPAMRLAAGLARAPCRQSSGARRAAGRPRLRRRAVCRARGPTRSGSPSGVAWRRHRDDKRLYLQEDTRRSTRDYSIGGSAPQHIASWRRSGRPGRPWPDPSAPARAITGRSSRLRVAPDLSRTEIRVELIPGVAHRRMTVADVHAPVPGAPPTSLRSGSC